MSNSEQLKLSSLIICFLICVILELEFLRDHSGGLPLVYFLELFINEHFPQFVEAISEY